MLIRSSSWRLIVLALVVVSLPVAAGYAWLFLTSVNHEVHGLRPVGGWEPHNWRFLWDTLVGRPSIWLALWNTLVFTVCATVLEVILAAMAAYSISRLRFRGRGGYLGLVLVLHAFPAVSLLIAIYYVLRLLGLLDSLAGVIIVKAALDLPLGIWLLKGFFDNLSWDMEMAALVDGASRWGVFWRVALPLTRPGLLALGTFALLSAWGEFILPYTLIISGHNWTLALFLQSVMGDFQLVDYGLLAAVGLFYILPVVIMFLIGQRYLLNIYGGGSKG
ncbi:MAG TPA: carbohydrate ABC transporter permease [Trueperaceae bacterium]